MLYRQPITTCLTLFEPKQPQQNVTHLPYHSKLNDSPFRKFFASGLNVALSTDDPLLFHLTEDPLVEEFTGKKGLPLHTIHRPPPPTPPTSYRTTHHEPVARACFGLSMPDMCEIARNSVLQSGFSDVEKMELLGENWDLQDRFR